MNIDNQKNSMRVFYTVWAGQFTSTLGSTLTSFALSIWIYTETRSASLFGFTLLAAMLPRILFSPVAGVVADRYDRRLVMLFTDIGAAASTLFIGVFLWFGDLRVEYVLIANFINATFNTFQSPAYLAAIPLVVPGDKLGNANGMIQLGDAVSRLLAPAVAGAAYVAIGLKGIILIDFATFLVAAGTLWLARFAPLRRGEMKGDKPRSNQLWAEVRASLDYLKTRKGLAWLIIYIAIINLFSGMIAPLIGPMLLDLTTPTLFGILSSLMGVGMVVGTLYVSVRGVPGRRVLGITVALTLMGLCTTLLALPSLWIIGTGFFLTMMMIPIASTTTITILQTKIKPEIQGRIFALFNMINWSTPAVAAALAGPLAERFFEPLLVTGGPLADTVGQVIGVGPGRGIGLFFVVIGTSIMLSSLLAYVHAPIRRLEEDVPDVVVSRPLMAVRAEN